MSCLIYKVSHSIHAGGGKAQCRLSPWWARSAEMDVWQTYSHRSSGWQTPPPCRCRWTMAQERLIKEHVRTAPSCHLYESWNLTTASSSALPPDALMLIKAAFRTQNGKDKFKIGSINRGKGWNGKVFHSKKNACEYDQIMTNNVHGRTEGSSIRSFESRPLCSMQIDSKWEAGFAGRLSKTNKSLTSHQWRTHAGIVKHCSFPQSFLFKSTLIAL